MSVSGYFATLKTPNEPLSSIQEYDVATVYIGNLPYDIVEDDLHKACTAIMQTSDVPVKFRVERLRPKRGFAYVELGVAMRIMPTLLIGRFIAELRVMSFGGRVPVVELQGESAVHELRTFCAENDLSFPVFTQITDGSQRGFLLRAELQDGTLICPAQKGSTLKFSRRACATACLEFFKAYSCSAQQFPPSSDTTPHPKFSKGLLPKNEGERRLVGDKNCSILSPPKIQASTRDTFVRNCSIIAHVDHGKTTLSDSLLSKAGLLSKRRAGFECSLDTTDQERDRGITIHSTAVSLSFPAQHLVQALCEKDGCLREDGSTASATLRDASTLDVNLIDSPGHVDFNAEVVAALRITDGAIVIVDAIEGVCVQTNILLRQALAERVKPVLFINKCDRLFVEKQMNADDTYDCLVSTIAQVNAIIDDEGTKLGMSRDTVDTWKVFLEDGSAIIGSGYFGWAFDVDHVVHKIVRAKAKTKAAKAEIESVASRLSAKLRKRKGWSRLEFRQAFTNRLLNPLVTMHKLCLAEGTTSLDNPDLAAFLDRQQIDTSNLSEEIAMVKKPKDVLRLLMRAWAPAAACMVKLIALHLPSPKEAQLTRIRMFYPAPTASPSPSTTVEEVVNPILGAMEACDPNGAVMMYITKVVQLGGTNGSIAVGRLFSGKIKRGSALSILPPEFRPEDSSNVKVCHVKRLMQLKGVKTVSIEVAEAGDIVGLVMSKVENSVCGATFTSHPLPGKRGDLLPFAALPLKAAPIVRVAVKALHGGEHASKLRAALKVLCDSDPCLKVKVDQETGENIIAGAGELHLDTAVHSLRGALGGGVPLQVTPPMVSYRETVMMKERGVVCLAKTANKLNRIWVKATRLPEDLVKDIEDGTLASMTAAERVRLLVSKHSWEKSHASKIWCFGPEISVEGEAKVGTNILVDSTVGLSNMDALKGDLQAAFQKICCKGPLAGEQLCGVRFDIVDAKIHPDAAHRRTAQILPAGMRVLAAAVLAAEPALLEPLYEASIRCHESITTNAHTSGQGRSDVGMVYSLIRKHRATLAAHGVEMAGGGVGAYTSLIRVLLPVLNTGGFMSDLRVGTSGRSFVEVRFDRYALCMQHYNNGQTPPLIAELRTRNKLNADVPSVASIVDKL